MEEAHEASKAGNKELLVELADVLEVVDNLLEYSGIGRDIVLEEQKRRRAERGGFSKRIRLLWAE